MMNNLLQKGLILDQLKCKVKNIEKKKLIIVNIKKYSDLFLFKKKLILNS